MCLRRVHWANVLQYLFCSTSTHCCSILRPPPRLLFMKADNEVERRKTVALHWATISHHQPSSSSTSSAATHNNIIRCFNNLLLSNSSHIHFDGRILDAHDIHDILCAVERNYFVWIVIYHCKYLFTCHMDNNEHACSEHTENLQNGN